MADNVAARRYITEVAGNCNGKAPQIFPIDIFEVAWSLWNLFLASVDCHQTAARHLMALKALWDRGEE